MRLFDPMLLIVLAQRSPAVRWMLGLHNFSLMPPPPPAGPPTQGTDRVQAPRPADPVRRLQIRMVTTLAGILAFMLTVLTFCLAGIASGLGARQPAAWILMIGGGAMLLVAGRALIGSLSNRMPTPGVLIITVVADVAAVAWGVVLVL